MEQELKNDLIATWNEAEELSASLSQLTNDEIIECKDSLMIRIENIKHWIGKYVSDDEIDGLYQDISKMETTQTDHIGDTNKMVTAVEWFYDRLKLVNRDVYNEMTTKFEKAKQREREKLNIARLDGINLANKG